MAALKFKKVNSVPGVLEANTIYIVKDSARHILYITDKDGIATYKSYDSTDIASITSLYIESLIGQPEGLAALDNNGDIIGNAATASALETPRNINGVPFDGTTNITISSAIAFKEVTLDFGNIPVYSKSFNVTEVGASTNSKILICPSANPAAGKSADDLEMDGFSCSAVCLVNGELTIIANAVPGPVTGQYKFNYSLG